MVRPRTVPSNCLRCAAGEFTPTIVAQQEGAAQADAIGAPHGAEVAPHRAQPRRTCATSSTCSRRKPASGGATGMSAPLTVQ
jgi:hypothetical protein